MTVNKSEILLSVPATVFGVLALKGSVEEFSRGNIVPGLELLALIGGIGAVAYQYHRLRNTGRR